MANDPWFKKVTLLSHLETAPVVDPFAQYLLFGHHCDSADAVDVTGKACSYVGVAFGNTWAKDGSSMYQTAARGSIRCSHSSLSGLGTSAAPSQFTIEFWTYIDASATTGYHNLCSFTDSPTPGSGTVEWQCYTERASAKYIIFDMGATSVGSAANSVLPGAWYHVAFVRDGANINLYINGTLRQTASWNAGSTTAKTYLHIGDGPAASNAATAKVFIDEFRIYSGVAKYTTPFTPSSARFSVVSDIEDVLGKAMLRRRGAAVLSGAAKFGAEAVYFPASGYVDMANVDLAFGTGDFTIEGWININAPSVKNFGRRDAQLMSLGDAAGTRLLQLAAVGDATNTGPGGLSFYESTTGQTVVGAGNITNNAWHHVAVSRIAGVIRMFLDGTLRGSLACTASIGGASSRLVLGGEPSPYYTSVNQGMGLTSQNWSAVCWNGSVFCAVASGSVKVATSPDGRAWTVRDNMPSAANWNGIAWNGTVFCAISTGAAVAATSPDGITWTARTLPASAPWNNIVWAPSLNLFCAISSSLSGYAGTSPDGETWTLRSLPVDQAWASLGYNAAAGGFTIQAPNSAASMTVASSADGVTWTLNSNRPFTNQPMPHVPYGAGVFLHFQSFSSASYATRATADGPYITRTFPATIYPYDCIWTGSKFVLTCSSGVVYTSPDGLNWTAWTPFSTGVYLAANSDVVVGVKNSQWAMAMDANTPLPSTMYLDGYVDEWRVTKGVGRYLTDFTPPNGQFPSAATGVSGTVKESDGSPRSCKVFAYSHATGALLGSAVSDAGTGAFYIAVPERCYCVCLDDDANARNAIVYDRLDPV